MSLADLQTAQAELDQLRHDRAELLRQLEISEDQRRHIINFGAAWRRLQDQPKGAA